MSNFFLQFTRKDLVYDIHKLSNNKKAAPAANSDAMHAGRNLYEWKQGKGRTEGKSCRKGKETYGGDSSTSSGCRKTIP